jgi:hypothetical protein
MKNYKYVTEYDTSKTIDEALLDQALYNAWKNTPSKNNFMPYKVHVLKTNNAYEKELVYYKCLENETKANGNHCSDLASLKAYEEKEYHSSKPNFYNIKSAHYILLFTQRVEDQLNDLQQRLIDKGFVYEQTFSSGPKYDASRYNALIEIGMFCSNFSNICLSLGIDISHTLCFPKDLKYWTEKEFNFLDSAPLLIMTAGIALKYRRDHLDFTGIKDHKPNFDRIVNFLGNTGDYK